MPTLKITVPKDDLSEEEKKKLIIHLTNSVSTFYQNEKGESVKEFVNVQITETASSGYAVGGEVIG